MFDIRDVSWLIAFARIALSVIVLAGSLFALNIIVYLNATNSTYNERIALAFRDAYDYGYTQTFDAAYKQAREEAFDRGYDKGYEISRETGSGKPISRLIRAYKPTFNELMTFLAADKTDEKPYIEGEYVCFDYAAELNNKADAAGIPAAYVRLRSNDWGHAVVAFHTADKGIIYIEPQSDAEVKLVIGQPYPWRQVDATSPLSASDPILEIELIW